MPNFISNYVEIKGAEDKLKQLVKDTKFKLNNIENKFDFNAIIPMPEELENTISPVQLVATDEEALQKNAEHYQRMDKIGRKDYENCIAYITEAESRRRMAEYGADEWYHWSVANWGTKWNANDVEYIKHEYAGEDSKIVLSFLTAWSAPEPIYAKLEEMGFKVSVLWHDENPENYGSYGEDAYTAFSRNWTIQYEGDNNG